MNSCSVVDYLNEPHTLNSIYQLSYSAKWVLCGAKLSLASHCVNKQVTLAKCQSWNMLTTTTCLFRFLALNILALKIGRAHV